MTFADLFFAPVYSRFAGGPGFMKAEARKVMVAGCFDLLHASHVVFLNKAATLGDLHVSLGSDQSIITHKKQVARILAE